ncbi:uncharacterized protein BDV14DRAFT_147293 [Aspergillus stella-maris]|uniref:uncharacterized protein n=1 Tax=Aspergillus stella-maris TaxID=1810926 RepID=UPI003CCD3CA2
MAPNSRSPRGNSLRQSRPVRSNRTLVQSYNEDSSGPEDDLDEDNGTELPRSRRLSLSLRPRDSHRIPASYREESTDDDFENFRGEDPDTLGTAMHSNHRSHAHQEVAAHPTSAPQMTPQRSRRKRSVRTRSQSQRTNRTPTKRRLELGRPLNKRRRTEEPENAFVGSGVIPPWQTLPYHILFDIFRRASYPLVDEKTVRRHSTVNWLVDVALLCRSFHEPALAALYHTPPLIPAPKSHSLLSLLVKPQESLSTNYANKIKELHVDVEALLVYKSGPTLGYFELHKLIEHTPQINVLRLYHNNDYTVGLPPWEMSRSRWVYPETLFAVINSSSIRLTSWDWNARFMNTQNLLPVILANHRQTPFKSIRELRILHASAEDADGDEVAGMTEEREHVLAEALKELPNLRQLEFVESSIVNDLLLPRLSSNLTSLTVNNCDDVTTANFRMFLASHGKSLRELSLSHNRHLSLSFIVDLKGVCQSLEKFTFDLSMHDQSSYHDMEPHFDELLSQSEIPTWPSTLQHIEMIQLRRWNDSTAEAFFHSLIEAAPELPQLRRLIISAILKTGWRDRAVFREKWISKLEKVFLRRSAPPDPSLCTVARDSQLYDPERPESSNPNGAENASPSKRKSARIASLKQSDDEDNASPSPSGYRHDDDSDNDISFTQGMCDMVVIRIDNQRPRETQLTEQDFLDDELSGDDEWNGYDVDMGDGGHAW